MTEEEERGGRVGWVGCMRGGEDEEVRGGGD